MKNLKQTSRSKHFLQFTKLAFVVLLLITSASSCSKSNVDEEEEESDTGYFIRFNANGQLNKFTPEYILSGNLSEYNAQYSASIIGKNTTSSIIIHALDNKTIIEKSYSGYVMIQATPQTPAYNIGADIFYHGGDGIMYTSPLSNSDVTIKIEKITPTTIRGTFNGTLKFSGKPDLVITNGKFHVERKSQT